MAIQRLRRKIKRVKKSGGTTGGSVEHYLPMYKNLAFATLQTEEIDEGDLKDYVEKYGNKVVVTSTVDRKTRALEKVENENSLGIDDDTDTIRFKGKSRVQGDVFFDGDVWYMRKRR